MIQLADVAMVVGGELALCSVFILFFCFVLRSFKGKAWKIILIITAITLGILLINRRKKP